MIKFKVNSFGFFISLIALLGCGCSAKKQKTHEECLQEHTTRAEAIRTYASSTDEDTQRQINESIKIAQDCSKKVIQDNVKR